MNHIRLIGADREWNGSYRLDGDSVCVSSAYGGQRASIGEGVDPEIVALAAFEAIVKRWAPATKRAVFKPAGAFSARR